MSVGLAPIEAAELGARSPQRFFLAGFEFALENIAVNIFAAEKDTCFPDSHEVFPGSEKTYQR